jgi:hypothetical protein
MAKFTVKFGMYYVEKDCFFDAANFAADIMDSATEEHYDDTIKDWKRVPIKKVEITIEREEEPENNSAPTSAD